MKLKRGKFWLYLFIIFILEAAVMLVGVDVNNYETLSPIRIALLIVLFILYLLVVMARISDVGLSPLFILLVFFLPITVIVFGFLPSKTPLQQNPNMPVNTGYPPTL